MFTQCPECHQSHFLTSKQFQKIRGKLRCTNCSTLFNCSEQHEQGSENQFPAQPLPWEISKKPAAKSTWHLAVLTGIGLFLAQIIFFEGYNLTQNPSIRSWLIPVCQRLNCQLARYRNPKAFDVLHRSLSESDAASYTFNAVISNQSRFGQNLPKIKLTLLDYTGKGFAQRIFTAEEYLPSTQYAKQVMPNEAFNVQLQISAPATRVGGFAFDIL